MKILGRKVRIPPTPAMIPLVIREISISPAPTAVRPPTAASVSQSRAISKYPFSQSPTVKVRKNTSPMIRRNTGRPSTG